MNKRRACCVECARLIDTFRLALCEGWLPRLCDDDEVLMSGLPTRLQDSIARVLPGPRCLTPARMVKLTLAAAAKGRE